MNVLFLCTGNSCRSQMAEGFSKALKSDLFQAYSAGIEAHGMNPYAVKVMAEVGIDISQNSSELVEIYQSKDIDYVVTVCGSADAVCPSFPGEAKRVHIPFNDPPKLAKGISDEEKILDVYRKVRDEIRATIADFPNYLLNS